MDVIQRLLERIGFVRLKEYGLILTPDRRVVTTRQILDDGFGSHIVGWPGADLAVIELATPPQPPRQPPEPPRPPALAVALAPPPRPPPMPAPARLSQPEEDEWEWEIAVARARAVESTPMKRLVPEPLDASSFDDSGDDDTATEVQPVAPWAPRMLPSVITVASASVEQPDAQTPPRTILPVPALPVGTVSQVRSSFEAGLRVAPMPRRFPRGTRRVA